MSIDHERRSSAEICFQRARAEAAKGDIQQAAESLRETVKHAPFHREANAHLAWLLSQQGDYRAALPFYFKFLLLNPFSLKVHARTAQCLYFGLRSLIHRVAGQSRLLTKVLNTQRAFLSRTGVWLARLQERLRKEPPIVSQWVRHHWTIQRLAEVNDFEYYKIAEMRFTVECLVSQKRTILDLGSGRSGLPTFLVRRNHTVVSAELDRHALSVQNRLAQRLPAPRLSTATANFLSLPFRDESFDAISLISTIEHVPGDGDIQTIRSLSRYLKPGGDLIVTVPAESQPSEQWTAHTIGHIYGEAKSQNGASGFLRVYDPRSLRERLIIPSGMKLIRLAYFGETSEWGWFGLGRNWIGRNGRIHPSVFAAPLHLRFTRELDEADLQQSHWAVACIHLRNE